MSCYFISIGGSGAKILEALTHLTAAGVLPGAEDLNVIALDPDEGNGNLERTKSTLEFFKGFQDVQVGAKNVLFKNKVQTATPFPFNPVPRVGSNLDSVMNAPLIAPKPLGQLYKVLYSKRERQTPLDEGFRGHPSIGAAVMTKQYTDPNNHQWDNLKNQIKNDIGAAKSVKVFLAGSIFGGTGAAGIPTIARLLKNTFHGGISIGGVLMLPYFSFIAGSDVDGKLFAKSENFLTSSKAALKYYSQGQNDFDYMYFLGDNSQVNSDFSIGGQTQRNNAHIVDLYGALAAVDFFANATPWAGTQYNYICRENDNEFKWGDFQNLAPDFKQRLIQFSRFVFTYVQFIKPTLDNPPIVKKKWWGVDVTGFNPPWYLPLAYTADYETNTLTPDADKIMNFNRYIIKYCTWLKQLETLSGGRTISLVNPNVFNVAIDKNGHSNIYVDSGAFPRCDPTELQGGLTLNTISNKLSNVTAKVPGQGFGKILRHVYDSCTA